MRTKVLVLLTFLTTILATPHKAQANENASVPSASLARVSYHPIDNRVKVLQAFLTKYHSPLAGEARTFIMEADANNLDWRFVASIAGVESYFGQYLPEGSNNGWGWGIFDNNMTTFPSFSDGIKTISKGIREQYMNEWGAKDIYEIGTFYAADPLWSSKVAHFMEEIDQFQEEYDRSQLSISI